jgi:two-component system sensor histidine kinase TctE
MLFAAAVAVAFGGGPTGAQESVYPAPAPPPAGQQAPVLTVAGATDTGHFAHFIRDFQAMRPEVKVVYVEMDTIRLYDAVVAGTLPPSTDLIVSSAADLQVKLANDGYARAHESDVTARLPAWARWRSEVFGFTYEPAVIVYNNQLVPEAERPRSHLALTELLEREPERFRGRVGTYDIAQSGVGHLLAMQDAQISSNFWRLVRAFGRVDAELGDSSPQILDLVEEGELALGYNVLGSYAFGRLVEGGRLGVVVPEDYTLVLTRTMLIPRSADDIALAGAFIDYALSPRGQAIAAGPSALGAVVPGSPGEFTAETIARASRGIIHPVALGPALLVALDQQRKARGLETWRRLVSEP